MPDAAAEQVAGDHHEHSRLHVSRKRRFAPLPVAGWCRGNSSRGRGVVVTVSYVRGCKVDKDAGTGFGEPVRVLDGIHGGLGWETGASAWGTGEVHVSATGPRSMTSTDTLWFSLSLEAST